VASSFNPRSTAPGAIQLKLGAQLRNPIAVATLAARCLETQPLAAAAIR
jgi:hypothetical protein